MKLLLLILVLLIPAQSELPEYGEETELLGKSRVYVTADDPDSRKLILSEFKKSSLKVVNSPEEAEFILEYTTKASTEALGRRRSHYLRSQLVAYVLTDKQRRRILWSENETYEESGGMAFSRPNEINLARNFLKRLKKLSSPKQ